MKRKVGKFRFTVRESDIAPEHLAELRRALDRTDKHKGQSAVVAQVWDLNGGEIEVAGQALPPDQAHRIREILSE